MPADDSLFEKALARQLRNRGADNAAGTNGESASDGPFAERNKLCPDVELLAAYHERSLANEEMNLWKEHIFSCASCQEILSQLETTENILVNLSEQDQGLSAPEGASIPMTSETLASAPVRSAAVHELHSLAARANAPTAGAPIRPQEAAAKKRLAVRYWLVPAGAIAAALLAWIAIHPRSKNISNSAEGQIAENRQPNQSIPDQSVEAPIDRGSASSDIKNIPVPKTQNNARNFTELDSLARKKSSVKKPSLAADDKAVARAGTSAAVSGGAAPEKLTAQADGNAYLVVPKATTQSVEVTAAAPPVSTQVQVSGANQLPLPSGQELQTSQMAAAPAPAARPQNGVDKAKDKEAQARNNATAASSPGSFQAGTGAGTAKGIATLRTTAAVQNIHMIAAPGGNVIWRVGIAGLIEESANAGGSWTRQNSGVSVVLDSGAAPSASVCWVFGHEGTILRTIDGGAHWTKIVSPIAGDVGGVLAVDALHAAVWDVGKKNNFVTADGGATWTRVANP